MAPLETLGCDFKNVVPTWDAWPMPYSALPDPFDYANFKLCLERAALPFEKIVNFLGQSTLHVGVCQPQRMAQLLAAGHPVDLCDKNGVPRVMYAAAMNIPDAVMMLIRHGADICPRKKDLNILGLIVKGGNWDLIWQILDLAAEMDPDLIPELFRSFLFSLHNKEYEACYAAHGPGGQDGCINFWSRVISKLGSPNFTFDDGTTLMHMTTDSKSARALIDLGFENFTQEQGDLLEHIASLHDPSLLQFAIANGGDVHVRNFWGGLIVDALLYDLVACNWKDFPTIWKTLQVLVDKEVSILSPHGHVRNFTAADCTQSLRWELDRSNIWLLAWLEMLENKRTVEKAKEVSLAALREMSLDEAGLHHKHCAICKYDLGPDIDNDRFWDITEEIKIDELNRAMEVLAEKTYPELKMEVMTSEHPKIPEPFLSSWNGIVRKKLDSGHWNFDYDIELGLVKFGIGLYQCGGDQFESWLPLLTQMTDVLLAEEKPGAPKP
ncbi:hypothetical protein FCIRC_5305 [Fusarium circinatum]|uniref:Ankyrin n=1 Tax=Fusarium circinatum TaxID=48490 RepID=A0A8H5U4I9_FUSCI|nr:hypothetical protein FCIRC_5305 [Fusarium circinatum]